MSLLREYNPLSKILLPQNVSLETKGLIVVVGPNSSGKTRLLRDISGFIEIGNEGHFVVCQKIVPQFPHNPKALFEDLLSLRYITESNPNQHHKLYSLNIPQFDLEPANRRNRPQFTFEQFQQAATNSVPRQGPQNSMFSLVGEALNAYLPMGVRIETTTPVDRNNMNIRTPLHDLQFRGDAQRQLSEETARVFGNCVVLDQSESTKLRLRVTGQPNVDHWKLKDTYEVNKYREITDEGDGYRSYVGTCMSLLLGIRPVTMIDEPELCLHPPQAFEIGRFIGKNAAHDKHLTLVATHSSHVLRGILETTKSRQILRMTHEHDRFSANLVPENELAEMLKHPRSRAETILDGIFSQAVCLVEADGDRDVYQAALDDVGETYKKTQIHFVPVSGIPHLVPPCRFFNKLRIPFAVIADLDIITDKGVVDQVLNLLTNDAAKRKEILDKIPPLVAEVNKIGPSMNEQQVVAELERICQMTLNWGNQDDVRVKRDLQSIVDQLRRQRRLKGGLDAYSNIPSVHTLLSEIIPKCHQVGLFVVPNGDLESWVKHLMADVTGGRKPERALIAAQRIRDHASKTGDVWDFMKLVLKHLTGAD